MAGNHSPVSSDGAGVMTSPWARQFAHHLDVLDVLTTKALKARYKNTFLGYLWSVLNPLAYAAVFLVAFKTILRVEIPDYALFLISGLFPWQWLNNSLTGAPSAFISNAGLVKKVRFPRNLIVLSLVLQDGFHFAMSLPVIVVALFYFHRWPQASWAWGVPLLFIIQLVMVYGLALVVASCNVYFRDLERIVGLVMFVFLYATPIIYQESMVPPAYRWMVEWNPFAALMSSWRDLLLDGTVAVERVVISAVVAAAALLAGQIIYAKTQWKFAEAL